MILNLSRSISQPNPGHGNLCYECVHRKVDCHLFINVCYSGDVIRYSSDGRDTYTHERIFSDYIEICSSYTGIEDAIIDRKSMQHLIRFTTISPLNDADTIPILATWLSENYPDVIKLHRPGRAIMVAPGISEALNLETRGQSTITARCGSEKCRLDLHDPRSISTLDVFIKNWLEYQYTIENNREA